ncbi:MgtC/SapB family protein [Bacteroides propionicifaciens]|uniref:MgtC/SapB family protein n=1 Tax=Bacteroides propionicifaciens TaxID=392838 RepID=UPI00037D5535|nr:DUF4010 domain-containing protein [Bacteroides propionicifaciens]
MEKLAHYLPEELISFLLVTLFSLLIGLSQRKISLQREGSSMLFGTDRTFTFIGILGYILYILDPIHLRLFIGGGLILGALFTAHYFVKQNKFDVFGVTTIIIALITYCIGPIVLTQPSWFYILIIVTVLLLSELKHTFTEIAQRMQNDEMITLAKFLAISGIILPILPDTDIIPGVNLTPYTIWLATVVVSGISYLSYLLKRYVFKDSGIIVSSIIGGLYSSTATISILARKSKTDSERFAHEYVSGMLLAVSMMFLRFLILIFIFSRALFLAVYPYLLLMSFATAAIAWFINSKRPVKKGDGELAEEEEASNPLEFKVALIFAALFVVFTLLTHYTLVYSGTSGLNLLSVISGFSDITPFILNLVQGTDNLGIKIVAACSMQAMASNIFINMCYAFFFSGRGKNKKLTRWIFIGFGGALMVTISLLLLFYLLS